MADTYNFSLRMPIDLGETIDAMAKTDKRPMNTTIVLLLEYALKEKRRKRKNAKSTQISDNTTNPRQEYTG